MKIHEMNADKINAEDFDWRNSSERRTTDEDALEPADESLIDRFAIEKIRRALAAPLETNEEWAAIGREYDE